MEEVNEEHAPLSFEQIMHIYDHISQEERHFNMIELEYRKLASHWLLVSLGAIGYVISKESVIPFNAWLLVIAICVATCIGIFILWMLDLKVYHELLHAAFKEGVKLERKYAHILPNIRNNMLNSIEGGDVIKRVMLYYFFSIFLLIIIINISIWMYTPHTIELNVVLHFIFGLLSSVIYKVLTHRSTRIFN